MIVKATLLTLVLMLILVVASSYYVNKEGFDDISKAYYSNLTKNMGSAVNTVPADATPPDATPPASSTPQASATPQAGTIPQASATPQSSTPTRTDVMPEISISGSGYDAMSLQQRMDLLKDIQKAVRNELLASRSTTSVDEKDKYYKDSETDSTAQGKEYRSGSYKRSECPSQPSSECPPMPDMTQYIKKDAIPCWGCTLDY